MKLTVYFDGSFWCGLVEAEDAGTIRVFKHVFGSEPKDEEVWDFVANHLLERLDQVPAVPFSTREATHRINQKRLQRLVNREKAKPVTSTKSQVALQESREILKSANKQKTKRQKQAEKQRRFLQHQAKKMQNKKGH